MHPRVVRAWVPPGRHPGSGAPGPDGTLLEAWQAIWTAHSSTPVLLDGAGDAPPLTGHSLLELTAAAASALLSQGLMTGDRVLWSCSPGLEAIVVLLGALRAGAVVVPVSPSFTAGELAYVIGDAGPRLAVVEGDEQRGWVAAQGVAAVAPSLLLAGPPRQVDLSAPGLADDDALVVYTSGTTGQPKGAVHTHRSLMAGVQSIRAAWGWQPTDRLVLALPLFHVHGLCAGLFGTLSSGASAVVFPRFDEELVRRAAPSSTMFFGVPTMYHRLEASGQAAELGVLRLCVSGSAPLPAALWHRLADAGVAVLERYGMSETLLTLSNPLEGERRPGTVGTPLPGVEAAIEDPDDQGVGELLVRGPSLCRGYWGHADGVGADHWFATGDLASVDADGYVTICGRRTELIITGGHNVYPAEVEAVLARHASVAEVAVVGRPSPEWGESVVAFVVGRGGAPDLVALEALAAAHLAPYKRPRHFAVLDALPRNAMGKVIRRQLGE